MANPPNFTSGYKGQSGRFYSIYFGNLRIGGLQSVTWTESFGTHWVGEIGSDHKEPEFGMRQVSGRAERLTLNKNKLRDLFANGPSGGDASSQNVDLRNYQFTLVSNYHEKYLLTDNTDAGVGDSNPSALKETIFGAMFTDLTFSLGDATSLTRENITFIGLAVNSFTEAVSTPN